MLRSPVFGTLPLGRTAEVVVVPVAYTRGSEELVEVVQPEHVGDPERGGHRRCQRVRVEAPAVRGVGIERRAERGLDLRGAAAGEHVVGGALDRSHGQAVGLEPGLRRLEGRCRHAELRVERAGIEVVAVVQARGVVQLLGVRVLRGLVRIRQEYAHRHRLRRRHGPGQCRESEVVHDVVRQCGGGAASRMGGAARAEERGATHDCEREHRSPWA